MPLNKTSPSVGMTANALLPVGFAETAVGAILLFLLGGSSTGCWSTPGVSDASGGASKSRSAEAESAGDRTPGKECAGAGRTAGGSVSALPSIVIGSRAGATWLACSRPVGLCDSDSMAIPSISSPQSWLSASCWVFHSRYLRLRLLNWVMASLRDSWWGSFLTPRYTHNLSKSNSSP